MDFDSTWRAPGTDKSLAGAHRHLQPTFSKSDGLPWETPPIVFHLNVSHPAEHLVRNKALKEHTATHISLIDVEDEPKDESKPESDPAGPSQLKKGASSSSNLSRQGSKLAPATLNGQTGEASQGLFDGLQMEEDESKEVLSFEVIPEKVSPGRARVCHTIRIMGSCVVCWVTSKPLSALRAPCW